MHHGDFSRNSGGGIFGHLTAAYPVVLLPVSISAVLIHLVVLQILNNLSEETAKFAQILNTLSEVMAKLAIDECLKKRCKIRMSTELAHNR